MPRQANIVSFDAARRAASDTYAQGRGTAARGRILIGGDQSAIVKESPAPGASFLGVDAIPMPRRNGSAGRHGSASAGSRRDTGVSAVSRRGANPTPSWYDGPRSNDRSDEVFARPAAARAARFADDDAAADYDAQLEEALDRRQAGVFGRMRSRSAEKRRERTKERADRAYFRQYEAGKGSGEAAGGPRAAVYKGEMGASHKRSSRMQQAAASGSGSQGRIRRASADKGPFYTRAPFMGFAATVFCLVFAVAFLYGPAQQLYVDIREKDRLTAEYEAVVQRNEAIGQQVSALQTDAGVEDVARTQLGWVREGEHAVSVSGLDLQKESDFRGNIVSEDIELPDTWYSGVLDPIFGVK